MAYWRVLAIVLVLLAIGCAQGHTITPRPGPDGSRDDAGARPDAVTPTVDAGRDAFVPGGCTSDVECADDDPCTADRCVAGRCEHAAAPGERCDDGTFCNGPDRCDAAGACTVHDGDPCAGGTACDEGRRTCTGCASDAGCPGLLEGPWSACSFASECATSGVERRTLTEHTCNVALAVCEPRQREETRACPRVTEGMACMGGTSCEAFGACSYASGCATSGTRSRTCTDRACAGGACMVSTRTETSSEGCARTVACSAGASRGCTTSCGSGGTQTCSSSCAWGSCVPPTESCNGSDDDCDGAVDEGFRAATVATTYATLASHHSPCNGTTERYGANCNAAAHRFCAARACTNSGFGPVESDASTAFVTCVIGTVSNTTYTALRTHHGSCDGTSQRVGIHCNAAIHRYCASLGAASGFGPVENALDSATVTCVPAASSEVVTTSYTVLASHHGTCNGTLQRWGPDCAAAIHRFCMARGAASGFGPVENSGDTAVVTCVRP